MALSFERYKQFSAERIYEKFIANSGDIEIKDTHIRIDLKKKRELPVLLDFLKNSCNVNYPWMDYKKRCFNPTA
jgi:hypothetical protein